MMSDRGISDEQLLERFVKRKDRTALAALAPGPERNAEAVDQRQALRAAVASLTPEQREIVLLCYHEHATHAQAAEILDIPVGTLKSRLHAALRELRGRLSRETDA